VHTQPLTYAALVPCSKSSRWTAVRAASSTADHSSSVNPIPEEEVANLGREIRTKDGDEEIVGREIRAQAIYPEDLTALVCTHKARAVAEWDDETGRLKALHYEHEDHPR
jgi:hypothetical protein